MNRQKLLVLAALVLTVAMYSCVSFQDRTMTPQEREQTEILGSVTVEFTSFQLFHIPSKKSITNKAYSELMKAAQAKYGDNVEIRNISVSGGFSFWEALYLAGSIGITAVGHFSVGADASSLAHGAPYVIGFNIIGNFQKITATADVVLYSRSTTAGVTRRMTETITSLSGEIAENLPRGSTIAVLSVFSDDRNISEYIIGELEYNLVNSGRFTVVDRRRLDQIRNEQNFQMSGDVSDDSAISIGYMLGANIVITGEITGVGSNQRLILKALDVRTAQIITMVRGNI
jgi:hypothetical protein